MRPIPQVDDKIIYNTADGDEDTDDRVVAVVQLIPARFLYPEAWLVEDTSGVFRIVAYYGQGLGRSQWTDTTRR